MSAGPQLLLGDLPGNTPCVATCDQQRRLDERAQYLTALELARRIAPVLRVGELEALDALCVVPDEMLPLLRTPEGWKQLADYIAGTCGCSPTSFAPTIH